MTRSSTEKPGGDRDYFMCYSYLSILRRVRIRVFTTSTPVRRPSNCLGGEEHVIQRTGLLATSGTHTHGGLERVVDPPLEASQGTNHDDTSTEALGGKSGETGLRGDGTEGLALVFLLAHQGDQRVSGVRDDGADDTREVTGSKGDSELSGLAVGVLRSGEDVGVEELDNLLEEVELGHGIWDLCM